MDIKPHASELLKTLHQLQRNGYLCDTVLVAEDGQLKAHSPVLAAASPLFKEGLHQTEKPMEHVIVLPDFKCNVLETAVNFVYSGKLQVPDKCLDEDGTKQVIAALVKLGLQIPANYENDNFHETHSIDILTALQQFQRTGYLCDTILVAEDQQLKAHSIVLAAASSLFKEGLPTSEKPMEHVMVLSEFEFCIVTFALHYIYCGSLNELDLTESYIAAVTDALEKLGVKVSHTSKSCSSEVELSLDELALQKATTFANSFSDCISNGKLSQDSRLWNCQSMSVNTCSCSAVSRDYVSDTSQMNGSDVAVIKIEDSDNEIETLEVIRSEKACMSNEMKVTMFKSKHWDRKQSRANSIGSAATGKNKQQLPESYTRRQLPKKKLLGHNGKGTSGAKAGRKLECKRPNNSTDIVVAYVENAVELNETNDDRVLQPELTKIEKAIKDVGVRKLKLHKEQHLQQTELQLQCGDISPKPMKGCIRLEDVRRTYICDVCGISIFSAGALIQHKRVHTKLSSTCFECEICGVRMPNNCNFRRHLISHRGRRDYLCQQCGHSFTRLANLKDHIRKMHTEGINSDPDFKPFVCSKCGEGFRSPYWLKHHKIAAHLPGDDEARRLALKRSKLPPLEKLYFCPTCNDRFASKTLLSAHMRIHADETSFPFQCQICGKRFAVKSTLKVHTQTVHTDLRLHECLVCKARYKSKDGLRYHVKRIHNPKEPQQKLYQCCLCNISFGCARTLKEHSCTHKDHVCSTCGKQFASYSLLMSHETVHVRSDTRRYECSICKLKFRQLHHLRSHELRHSAQRPMYQCIVCKKAYKKKLSLKLHSARIHDIELLKNEFYCLPVSLESLKALGDTPQA